MAVVVLSLLLYLRPADASENITAEIKNVGMPLLQYGEESTEAEGAHDGDGLLVLEVVVNESNAGTWPVLMSGGGLYAMLDAFENWRIPLMPRAQNVRYKGKEYWPLAGIPGYVSKVDVANLRLDVTFSPQVFSETLLGRRQNKNHAVSPSLPSAFFNYDLNYMRRDVHGASTVHDAGILGEVGVSTNMGVLTNSFLIKNLANDPTLEKRKVLRLETTLSRDFWDKNISFKLGDASTRPGQQGGSVFFGGIQLGTNFSLTPGFARLAAPVLKGTSTMSSTLELYVNDVLRQVSNVPAGPFSIENLPTLTGSGEARVVVRDLLGRETVITQPFVTSNRLLALGLNDWTVEAGSIRRNIGSVDSEYGELFARGLFRRGITNESTAEGHAEMTSKQRVAGIGVVSTLPWQWIGNAAVNASQVTGRGLGGGWLFGLERQGERNSLFLQAEGASANYRQLGQDANSKPVKLQLAANWAYASERLGSLGLGFASVKQFDQSQINTMTANYSMRVLDNGSLSVNASRSSGDFSGHYWGLALSVPLGERTYGASASNSGDQTDFHVSAFQSPTQDNHLGWRVQTGQQENYRHDQGNVYYLGRNGNLTGDVSSNPDQTAIRLGASGGLLMADSHLFLTKKGNQSFALAEVSDLEGIGVGLGSQVLSKTNGTGLALVPQLVPYQRNFVRLDPQDIPVSAELDTIEHEVVPAYRSVVKVPFPVRGGRGALLKIRLDDGDVAPAGAIVSIDGDNQEFYVARRGEAYVTGLQPSNRLKLDWNARQCSFEVVLPPQSRDEIFRIGPLECHGVQR